MIDVEAYLEELRLMKIEIEDKPEQVHDNLMLLNKYYNRNTSMLIDIRAEELKSTGDRKKDLHSLLESAKDVRQGLAKTKEIFNTIIKESKYFNGKSKYTSPDESDLPWQQEETSHAEDQNNSFPQEDEILFTEDDLND